MDLFDFSLLILFLLGLYMFVKRNEIYAGVILGTVLMIVAVLFFSLQNSEIHEKDYAKLAMLVVKCESCKSIVKEKARDNKITFRELDEIYRFRRDLGLVMKNNKKSDLFNMIK